MIGVLFIIGFILTCAYLAHRESKWRKALVLQYHSTLCNNWAAGNMLVNHEVSKNLMEYAEKAVKEDAYAVKDLLAKAKA